MDLRQIFSFFKVFFSSRDQEKVFIVLSLEKFWFYTVLVQTNTSGFELFCDEIFLEERKKTFSVNTKLEKALEWQYKK